MENDPRTGASDDDDKLIPEWSQSGENQIIYLGLLVALILALIWGGANLFSGDDVVEEVSNQFSLSGTVDLSAVERAYGIDARLNGTTATLRGTVGSQQLKDSAGAAALAVSGVSKVNNRLRIDTETPATTVAALEAGDLQGAMDQFGVTGTIDGERAILTGYVGTANESATAEVAALRVAGITTVANRIVILEPLVEEALLTAGAREVEPTTVVGTRVTAVGYVDDDQDRAAAVAAAAAVDGVSGSIIDELVVLDADVVASLTAVRVDNAAVTVADGVATLRGEVADTAERSAALSAARVPGIVDVVDELSIAASPEPLEPEGSDTRDQLNELFEANPIQFASGSAEIQAVSFPTLDQAVELLTETDAALEVQGYTDKTGNAAANLRLSQDRADAVLTYLVSKGIGSGQLTAQGYGPTEEFAAGDSAEALAANRRVRFELT